MNLYGSLEKIERDWWEGAVFVFEWDPEREGDIVRVGHGHLYHLGHQRGTGSRHFGPFRLTHYANLRGPQFRFIEN